MIEEPSRPNPYPVGTVVRLKSGAIYFSNDVGGTSFIDQPGVRAEVIHAFWDYETGWRYHGRLLEKSVIERVREEGTSGHTPETYARNCPNRADLFESAKKAMAEFDPSRIFFSEDEVRHCTAKE